MWHALTLTMLALSGGVRAAALQPPSQEESALRIVVEAPVALAGARMRLESFDPERLAGIVRLVGLGDPGPAIQVVLADETSDWARRVSPWVVGLAFGADGPVVIFPARATTYPYDTLEDVLRHEVAHVLIARAARRRPIPRWFHEGFAMAAERDWDLSDRTRLVYELTLSRRVSLRDIDNLFTGSQQAQTRAYALAGALARSLLGEHGVSAPGDILDLVGDGAPFDAAFRQVTGTSLADAEAAFWRRQRLWTTWVPLATSTTTLWMAVTLLAMYAIRRRRQRSAEIRRRWDLEDGDGPESPGLY